MTANLWENLKKISKNKGLSIKNIEESAKLPKNSLYNWKKHNPSSDNLQKVAAVLGVSVSELLGIDSKENKDNKDLRDFLEDNMEHGMTYADHELTDEEKERLKIAMTQIFWKYHDKYKDNN